MAFVLLSTLNSIAQVRIIGSQYSSSSEYIEPMQKKSRITITSVGDIMCHNTQLISTKQTDDTYDFSQWFKPIEHIISSSDLAICNLETTFAGKELVYSSYPQFNTPESLASTIKATGFDVVATANNHCLDRRNEGLVNTIDVLDSLNLDHTGTYKNSSSSQQILFKEIRGIKIAFINYTYGTNGIAISKKNPHAVNIINETDMISDIDSARSQGVDLIIFMIHFGYEYHRDHSSNQSSLVDTLFYNGAHVVLGSHPHVIQGHEFKKVINKYNESNDCFVIYSQGNFISNQRKQYRDSGVITELIIEKNHNNNKTAIKDYRFVPTWVDKSYINNNYEFRVMPVAESIRNYENKKDSKLTKYDYNRLKQVIVETNSKLRI